ncbi:carbonic anhydrase [Hephaestia caeni]|uniref:Carbonic anhydrase n=1 Tax=Hephaestia caeni TaxID=645617 RepID=A0A397PBR6_9SPHN|nr:carbonic anhydrase [Hephaestia caeni]RIA45843.1 carbonic anhydrase [Hephaestia caeni]
MTDFADLIAGYRRFHDHDYLDHHARWAELAQSQKPRVMVIACADSRTDPATVFDASPGEIFVVRNIANLVPPYEIGGGRHGVSAAIEFAVSQLEVPEIVVMGHGSCGGVSASLSHAFVDKAPGDGAFIANWVNMLDEARDRIVAEHGQGEEATRALELETVRVSIANIRTFPFVAEREAAGKLTLRGAYFAIRDGVLWVMDDTGAFNPVIGSAET